VFSGSLEIGISTIPQVAQSNEAGLDIVIAAGAGIISTSHLTTAVVVREGAKIEKPADFAGKVVMSPGRAGTFYLLFLRYLVKNGVDPESVRFVEGNFAKMGDVLRSGNVDAILTTEPFLSRTVAAGGRRIDYYLPDRDYIVSSVYIAKKSWADQHKEDLKKIRAALTTANEAMRADPAKSATAVAQYLKLPLEIVTRQGPPDTRPTLRPEDVQFWIDIARDQKMITKPMDAQSLMG
jgi:NitT/TauT family transport system substrate-binding protein